MLKQSRTPSFANALIASASCRAFPSQDRALCSKQQHFAQPSTAESYRSLLRHVRIMQRMVKYLRNALRLEHRRQILL